MAASDAKPVPQKNVAYRITFPILDADGDLVTGATGLDSEVSKDGGTFADCTNEATEIATSSGVYYLDLTSTEMNADTVAIIVKTSSSGAKTTTIVLYPEEAGDIRVNVTAFGGTAGTFSFGRPEVNTTHWGGTTVVYATVRADLINIAGAAVSTSTAQLGVNVVNFGGSAGTFASGRPAVNASYIGGVPVTATTSITFPAASTVATTTGAVGSVTGAVGSVTGNVGGNVTGSVGSIATGGIAAASFAAGAIDAAAIANGAIDAATFAADVDAEILSYIVDDATRIDASALNTATGTTIPTNLDATVSSRASAANLATVAGYLDTEIAAILEDTGTTIPAQIAALNNLSAAQVNAEVDTALADINLDHLVKSAVDTDFATTVHLNSVIGQLADNGTSATFDRTTDSLEAIRDRGDVAWVTATGFSTLDAAGVRAAVGLASANLDTQLDALPTSAENATAVRSELTTELGRIDVAISTRLASASYTAPLDAAGTRTALGMASANLDTQIGTLATAANLSTVAGYVDTEVAAIKAVTDKIDTVLVLDGAVYQFTANALELAPTGGSAPTAAEIADAVWDEAQADHVSAGSFGVIASEIADILTDTADIQPKIGTPTDFGSGTSTLAANLQDLADNGTATYDRATDSLQALRDRGDAAWVTATGFSTHSAADVWAVGTRVLTAGTNIDGSTFTAIPWNAAWDAEVQSEVQDAIEANHLDHLLAVTYDPASKPGAADALLNELVESDAGVARFTANALEQAPTGGSAPTASQIADEVQTRTIAAVTTVGTTTNLTNLPSIPANWLTAAGLAADAGAEIATAVRSELATELGRIDVATSTRLASASYTAPLDAAGTRAAVGLASANLDTQIGTLATAANLSTVAGYLDTEIAAILADTNELQTDWANGGRLDLILDSRASQSSVDTIDGIVDDILVDTAEIGVAGAGLTNINLPNQTMDIIGNITGNLSGSVGSVTGAVGSVTGNVGGNLSGSVGSVLGGINTTGGTITTLDALDTAQDSQHATTQGLVTTVDTVVDAIKLKTDNLPTDPADQSAVEAAITAATSPLATQASVNTIDDFLDTEIAAIKAKTDSLTFTVAGQVDANVQYVNDTQVGGTGASGNEWGPV